MVGKLLPELLPARLRPRRPTSRSMPRWSRARVRRPGAEVAQSTGIERTPEELAQGCLAIANDNMANAIKEISVQRGIDVTKGYALCCFGGAGSQHACQVADLLGIGRVFIHPYASRPLGLRHGPRRTARAAPGGGREAARPRRWSRELRSGCGGPRRGGASGAARAGASQDARIALEPRAHVRYAGTDTSLEVPLATRRDARRLRGRAPDPLRLRRRRPRPRGRGGHRRGHRRHGGGRPSRSCASPRASTRWSRCLTTPVFTNRAPHQPAERFEAAVYTPRGAAAGRPDHRAGAGLRRHHDGRGRARLGAGGDAARPPDPRPGRAAGARGRGRHAAATRSCSRSSTTCS